MASVTLASLQLATEAKYGSFDIELSNGQILKLRNPLRMADDERAQFQELASTEGGDPKDQFVTMITLAADDKDLANKFIGLVGDDVALLATVVEQYTDGVKVGEA